MPVSLYGAKLMLDSLFGSGTPATWWYALSTAVYSASATGTAMTEVAGGGYARIAKTNNATNFPAATGAALPATKSNGTIVDWGTASGTWGLVQSFYIIDSASGAGNIVGGNNLSVNKSPISGDPVAAAIGALVWTQA